MIWWRSFLLSRDVLNHYGNESRGHPWWISTWIHLLGCVHNHVWGMVGYPAGHVQFVVQHGYPCLYNHYKAPWLTIIYLSHKRFMLWLNHGNLGSGHGSRLPESAAPCYPRRRWVSKEERETEGPAAAAPVTKWRLGGTSWQCLMVIFNSEIMANV